LPVAGGDGIVALETIRFHFQKKKKGKAVLLLTQKKKGGIPLLDGGKL